MPKPQLWFVVPAYQRVELTRLCLAQLKRSCVELAVDHAIDAHAVVVADDENLETARELGHWAVEQENQPLGRKFNDGIELACQQGADYIVPFGTDNWIDPRILTELPEGRVAITRTQAALVNNDGTRLGKIRVTYAGGDGIRTFPARLFEPCAYRPAADYAQRAIDTSIIERLRRFTGWTKQFQIADVHDKQIVSFQSPDIQLNGYDDLMRAFGVEELPDPWHELGQVYDELAVETMRRHYERRR